MPSLADSLVASSARILPLRMRPDLKAKTQRYQGEIYWVIKEPVGLHYFRFQEEEYAILQMLDGHASLDLIKSQFEEQFPPQKITVEELGQFVGMLHRSGLVVADVPGQGAQLKKRRDERRRQEIMGALANILCVRFKGIDPDRLLNRIYPYMRWMYTRTAVVCCMLLAFSALLLVASHFDTFQSKLPTFHQFFTGQNWIWLAASLAVTKVIHEFGHGLTCKHYGGECHEMGVMFLVLTPCLYCNVSDSWMLPNKYHRAWIGAGGMYIEIVIASICTYLWWFSNPGLLNQICLSTMFVCSVSTVIFNANPLLRYDGYYILSDLAEIPNLRQKATSILNRKLGAWCLGLDEPEDPFLPQRNQVFFAMYSVAAAVYRWVVLFSILWFLYKIFEPYHLKVLSQMLAWASIAGIVGQPLWKLGKFFYVPGRLEQVDQKRLRLSLAVVGSVALFVFVVPLPYRVICSLEVMPRDAEPVYVDVAGRLEEVDVKPGQRVHKGDKLARLASIDLQLSIAELESKKDENRSKLEDLRRRRHLDPSAGLEIPQLQESLAAVEEQLRQKRQDFARLSLVAPDDGCVLPPPENPGRPDSAGQLPTWSGTPLEKKNLGAYLNDSVLFCNIGDPKRLEAVMVVEQDDIEFIREDQSVAIKINEIPGWTYHSQIAEIAKNDLKVTPRSLSQKGGGEVVSKQDEGGTERPMNTSYQARAPLDDNEGLLRIGLRGQAKVHARWQTLGYRGWRYLARTFNFKL
jgi:putative peptide zinc metalloprotease protein